MFRDNSLKAISHTHYVDEQPQYKYLIFLAMLSMTIMIGKGILSYRLVEINGYIMQAGQLIAPLWFILCDLTAEVYGYLITKKIIIAGLVCQIIFSLACSALINLPFPSFWTQNQAYQIVFGDMWRVSLAVLMALIISGFINIKLITKWKLLVKGKYFWLRCLGSSLISEFLFSVLATFTIQYGKQNLKVISYMILTSITLKFIYSIGFVVPASIAVFYLKRAENL